MDADRDKISQVIQNLIDNAVKFSSPDSSIEIQTTVQKDKIFVTVSDHGIGIPEESLPHIWDRFYKTDVSRGKDKTGSGLGLAITKKIIEAHGGTVTLLDKPSPGFSTEFEILLPAVM